MKATLFQKKHLIPLLFLLPALSLLITFNLLPALATINESFYRNSLNANIGRQFAGLANFARVFNDPVFWDSLKVTLAFNMVINPLQTALAFLLALLMNQNVRGMRLFRTVYLIPVAISINVTTVVWGLMMNQNAGLINSVLVSLGLPRQPFLLSAHQALWSVIMVATWKGVPFWAIFFLAGLQSIPRSVVEAAQIDGANRVQLITRITIPLLRRVFAFVLVADTVANFILFAPIYLLTRGGPEQSTNLIMYEIYRRGFVYGDIAGAAAMLTVVLVVVLAIVVLQLVLFQNRD